VDSILLLLALLNLFVAMSGVVSLSQPGGWLAGLILIGAGSGGAIFCGALAAIIGELKRIRRVLENQAFGRAPYPGAAPVPETPRRSEPRL
jgi:hypothetical protein